MVDTHAAAAKSALFREMVRTALIISHQAKKCTASDILIAVHEIGAIDRVSRRIPAKLSASEAADEYIISQWDEFEGFREGSDYVHPNWTGLASPEEIRALIEASETEELIDGVWQVENPAWANLPGDDSNILKALAHIRDYETATMADLAKVLPHLDRRSITRLLEASEAEDHLIRRTKVGRDVVWKATSKLINGRTPSQPRILPIKADVEAPAEQQERKLDPLEKKVLAIIRRRGQITNAEVRKEAPHLAHHQVRRLLQRMRDEGLIYVEGATKAAAWRLAEPDKL